MAVDDGDHAGIQQKAVSSLRAGNHSRKMSKVATGSLDPVLWPFNVMYMYLCYSQLPLGLTFQYSRVVGQGFSDGIIDLQPILSPDSMLHNISN
jgi:hypothetical protein